MEKNKPGRRMGLWTRTAGTASAMGLAAVLSACGGGGGDKAPTNTALPPVVDPSATSQSVFGLNLVYQSIEGVNTEALQVVDLRTGTVALTVDGQASGTGRVESTNTSLYAFTGGTTGRYDGISQLFTVEGHVLKQRDLRGKSVGAAQTVYALTAVCTAYHVHALNKEGDQGWVEVITADAEADCETGIGTVEGGATASPSPAPAPATPAGAGGMRTIAATTSVTSPTQARLVPFGVAGADTSMPSGSQGLNWVSNLYNKPDEPAIGVLAIDRTKGLLNVYSTDLKTVLSNVVLPSGPLSAADTVSIEGTLPTSTAPTRSLLRIGTKLYLASITGTQVSLGTAIRTLKSATSFDAIPDDQNLYFADGNTLVQVRADGTLKTLTTLPADVQVSQLNVTGGSLVFTQSTSLGFTPFVTALNLATGVKTQLVTDEGGFNYTILRAEGGVVWIESTDPGTRRSEITRMKVDGTDLQGVQSGIARVALLQPSSFTFGSAPKADAVLWCEVPEGETTCLNLWQMELVSGASVLLGNVPIDAGWAFDSLYEHGNATSDRPGLLRLGQTQPALPDAFTGNQKGSTLWFTPGKAGSLKAVVVPKP